MARFLVVDDEPIIAMTMADWLFDLGHDVIGPASDLDEALALCQTPFDAAFLDVSLGKQTTQTVAERLTARGLPFAEASGHDSGTLHPAFAPGLSLPKPFGFESFRQIVALLLGERT